MEKLSVYEILFCECANGTQVSILRVPLTTLRMIVSAIVILQKRRLYFNKQNTNITSRKTSYNDMKCNYYVCFNCIYLFAYVS